MTITNKSMAKSAYKYADFKNLAEKVDADKYANVAVGGFHCYDCVEKLANELLNRETLTGAEIREIVFGKKETKKIVKKSTTRKNAKPEKQ